MAGLGEHAGMKRVIHTPSAAEPAAAYSQATTDGDLVFTAGQVALTEDGEFLEGEGVDIQTRQALENIKNILEEEGLTLQDVLKVTVFLDDIEDYETMNDAYMEYFQDNPPARSAIAVEALPLGAAVEIEAVAAKK